MSRSIHRLKLLAPAVVAALLALFAGATAQQATAAGNATTFTDHFHNEHVVEFDYFVCDGETTPGRLTIDINGVFHVTELTNGTVHVTVQSTGQLLFEPIDSELMVDPTPDPTNPDETLVPVDPDWAVIPGATTYAGRYTRWFGFNGNAQNETGTFTFRVNARGSDGSTIKLNAVAHFSTNGGGEIKVAFDKLNCH